MEVSRMDDGVVRVKGNLHISNAEELRSALLSELAVAPDMVLEVSGVESCDTAGFQLLCSLKKSAERDGKKFHISTPSTAMLEASAMLGLCLKNLENETNN